ncbi:MAG: hypothetical protein ACK6BG_09580 [Cyanobacteriota bacterium]|nr:hypothetical protein [Cyanobacteriota bacterium]
MSTPHFENPVSAALSEEDLRQISGGVALVVGKSALASPAGGALSAGLVTGKLPGGVGPFNCNACVQGFPRDLLKDSLTNSAIRAVGF